jgi:hypothetical protein
MRNIFKPLSILFVSLLYTSQTLAVNYNYTTLIFKDYPDLKPLVKNAVRESRRFKYPRDGERAVDPLKKSLKMILSRPDDDNLVSKLSSELISDLENMGVFEVVVADLIKEGKEEVYNKALNPKVRATSLIMMNNLLLMVRPLALENVELAKSVCKLADDEIKIPKEVLKNTELTTMLKEPSPTILAKKIMEWYAKQKNKDVKAGNKGCPYSKKA